MFVIEHGYIFILQNSVISNCVCMVQLYTLESLLFESVFDLLLVEILSYVRFSVGQIIY